IARRPSLVKSDEYRVMVTAAVIQKPRFETVVDQRAMDTTFAEIRHDAPRCMIRFGKLKPRWRCALLQRSRKCRCAAWMNAFHLQHRIGKRHAPHFDQIVQRRAPADPP